MSSDRELTAGQVAERLDITDSRARRAMDEARETRGIGRRTYIGNWRVVRESELEVVRDVVRERRRRRPGFDGDSGGEASDE